MSNKLEIHHLIILDRSGSMGSVKEQTITGFNEIVEQIHEDSEEYESEQTHYVSLVLFNGKVETPIWREFAEDVEKLTEASYVPNGSTAMNDAIGISISRIKEELQNELDNKEAKVFVTIITDGIENASKDFTRQDSTNLVKELEEIDESPWMFNFIGANMDAQKEAGSRQMTNSMAYLANVTGAAGAFKKAARATASYSQGLSHNMSRQDIAMSVQDIYNEDIDSSDESTPEPITDTSETETPDFGEKVE